MTLVCPTADQMTTQALSLLPRGRAWSTHEVGPRPGTILYSFWRSTAELFEFVNQRLCDLHAEFFCATRGETDPLWLEEYGLPDGCDPFADVCVKVAATGGATCDYLAWIASRAGWSISCSSPCGAEAGLAEPGLDSCGLSGDSGTLIITVHAAESPSYVPLSGSAETGCVEAGQANRCDPLEPIRCLIERIAHAHLKILCLEN